MSRLVEESTTVEILRQPHSSHAAITRRRAAGLLGDGSVHVAGAKLFTSVGMRTDMVELLKMSMKTLEMAPDEPGTWLYHCHVNDHNAAGISALFIVTE